MSTHSKTDDVLDESPSKMDDRLKMVMTIDEDDHPGLSIQGWKEKAAKLGLSVATAK